jgi:hypothetical protein
VIQTKYANGFTLFQLTSTIEWGATRSEPMSINQLYSIWLRRILQLRRGERITRARNVAWLITGIFHSHSVQLSRVATKIPARVNLLSVVRRLSRWLNNPKIRVRNWYEPIARDWLDYLAHTTGEIRLIADGTKVGFGHQLLILTIAFRRRAIPLAWTWVEGSKGHSSACKQLALLDYVHRLVPQGVPVVLVGDSEFGAVEVLRQLETWCWHYVLRQKANHQIHVADQGWQNFGDVVSQPGQGVWLGKGWLTRKHAHPTYLLAHWQVGEEEPWLLATDLTECRTTLHTYARRMWIEEMFGDLKGNGFDLESTHLHTSERLSRLTLAVALLYTWLIDIGGKIIKNGLRRWVDRAERRDLSIFQIGFRSVDRRLTNGSPIRFDCPIGSNAKLSGG